MDAARTEAVKTTDRILEFDLSVELSHGIVVSNLAYAVAAELGLDEDILRVCDVFAALSSDRPYRSAFEVDTVMELMIDEIKNFDMEIFLAFQRVIHNTEKE